MAGHDNKISSTNRESDSTTQLTTKKFHLPVNLKQEIEDRAESNYSGNTSQLIRAAIHDHISTLDGNSDRQVALLVQEVKELQEEIDDLGGTVGEVLNQEYPRRQHNATTEVVNSEVLSDESKSSSAGNGTLQNKIYSALENTRGNGLTLTELTEKTDEPLIEVAGATEELVKRGLVNHSQDEDSRVYLINKP